LIDCQDRGKIEKAVLDYVGILGFAKASPLWVKKNILAVDRKEAEKIKAGLELADIEVKRVSGTLRGLSFD